MKRSWRCIRALAANTLLEALRQKVLNVLILFGLVILAGANFFTQFTFQEEFKFLKDLAYAAMSITGLLVAMMGAAQLIPAEIERRTLYTVMSKPVRRWEFVLGKYLGLLGLVTLMLAAMSAVFAVVLLWKEHSAIMNGEEVEQVRMQARDPGMLQAVLLIWGKLAVVAAIAVFFSTIATSTIYIVSTTLLIYFVGHLQGVARRMWLDGGEAEWWQRLFLAGVALVIPDLESYAVIDEIIAGNTVQWGDTLSILVYSGIYVSILLAVASLAFEEREL